MIMIGILCFLFYFTFQGRTFSLELFRWGTLSQGTSFLGKHYSAGNSSKEFQWGRVPGGKVLPSRELFWFDLFPRGTLLGELFLWNSVLGTLTAPVSRHTKKTRNTKFHFISLFTLISLIGWLMRGIHQRKISWFGIFCFFPVHFSSITFKGEKEGTEITFTQPARRHRQENRAPPRNLENLKIQIIFNKTGLNLCLLILVTENIFRKNQWPEKDHKIKI